MLFEIPSNFFSVFADESINFPRRGGGGGLGLSDRGLCPPPSPPPLGATTGRGQCVDQKRPLYVGSKQTWTWESFWSVGPYWQLMGLNWKTMGLLRQRVGPIWLSSIPNMAPWVPIQLSNAKTALAPKGLKRNLGSFWPFLIYSVQLCLMLKISRNVGTS
jgi:hypothetical protein